MSDELKEYAACFLAWWACLHFALEVLVLLFAGMGIATEGWFRFLIETYISLLWSLPISIGLPPISGPIFVLSSPFLVWLPLYRLGFKLHPFN
jgi:hypothetical protein